MKMVSTYGGQYAVHRGLATQAHFEADGPQFSSTAPTRILLPALTEIRRGRI